MLNKTKTQLFQFSKSLYAGHNASTMFTTAASSCNLQQQQQFFQLQKRHATKVHKAQKQLNNLMENARRTPRTASCLGTVADPYVPARSDLPQFAFKPLYTFTGAKERFTKLWKWAIKWQTFAILFVKVGPNTTPSFVVNNVAMDLYKSFKLAVAKQSQNELRNICTEAAYHVRTFVLIATN